MYHDQKQVRILDDPSISTLPLWWLLLTASTGILGCLIAVLVGLMTLGIGLLGAGAIVGFLVGIVQSAILRHFFPQLSWQWWFFSTGVGAAAGWILVVIGLVGMQFYDLPSQLTPVDIPLAYLIVGTVLGLAQWLALQRRWNMLWWIPVCGLGSGLSALIVSLTIHPFLPTGGHLYNPNFALFHFIFGSVYVLIFSIFLTLAVVPLFRQLHASLEHPTGS